MTVLRPASAHDLRHVAPFVKNSQFRTVLYLLRPNRLLLLAEENDRPAGICKARIVRRGEHGAFSRRAKSNRPTPDSFVQPHRYGLIEYGDTTGALLHEKTAVTALVAQCRQWVERLGVDDLRITVPADNVGVVACLEENGFEQLRLIVGGHLRDAGTIDARRLSSIVRPAEPEDISSLAELMHNEVETQQALIGDFQLVAGINWAEYLSACLDDPQTRIFVAELDGAVVGYIDAHYVAPAIRGMRARLSTILRRRGKSAEKKFIFTGIMEDIYVLPDYRRRGIADALVWAGLAWLQTQNVGQTYASIGTKNGHSLSLSNSIGSQPSQLMLRLKW